MNWLNRHCLKLTWVMLLVGVFWLLFGRGIFGFQSAWDVMTMFFTGNPTNMIGPIPLLLLFIPVFYILLHGRNKELNTNSVGTIDSFILVTIFVMVFLLGAFIPGSADTPLPPPGSLGTLYFGWDAAYFVRDATLILIPTLLVTAFFVFVYERIARKKL